MSGLFGVIDRHRRVAGADLAAAIAHRLSHHAWHHTEWFGEPDCNVALGRIGIGLFNSEPQPMWNADHTVAVLLAGELSPTEGAPPGSASPEPDGDLVLRLYAQYGQSFARHLQGAFVVAIWDRSRRTLVLANDRFGLYPLFYSLQQDRLVFAPEMKGVLCDSGFRKTLDPVALAQYARFQHLLGERTFLEDLRLLPPAATLVYAEQTGECRVEPYWSFTEIREQPNISLDDAVVEAGRLLRAAIRRQSGDAYRPGVFLSGGLDSRVILGMVDRRPVHTLTYGARNSRDVHYANKVARAAGSDHHWFDLPNGRWVLEQIGHHLNLTEGQHSWIHAHGMSVLAGARSLMDVNLSGWDGGTIMGHDDTLDRLLTQAVSEQALTTRLFELFNQRFTWPGLTEGEERLLYTGRTWRQMRGLAFDSFADALKPYLGLRPDLRAEYFYIRNHCGRLTHNMITMYRSHIEVRFPFFDYALFDFLYSLPAERRGHKVLYAALLERETPRLARIPYDHDEFLPTSRQWLRRAHALVTKAGRRARRILGGRWPERPTLYADYEAYLRNDLRPWAEGVLLDPQTTARGLFEPAFLRTLLARHFSGLEQWTIGKIAPLMTYEMMARQLVDG